MVPASVRSWWLVLALVTACAVVAGEADAQPRGGGGRTRKRLPSTPGPPGIPALTHADGEGTLELTSGAYYPRDVRALRGHVPVHVLRAAMEQPLHRRRVFVGAAHENAIGSPASARGPFVLPSNFEVHGRAVWATTTGLAFGAGLGVMLPTASWDRRGRDASSLATASVALRPWDLAFFQEGSLTLRPFVDVHDVVGRFVIQLRQVLDWTIDVREGRDLRLYSVATLFLGYRPLPEMAVGIETHQLYIIAADVADERRSFFSVSPAIRLLFDRVQPSIAVIKSLGAPYVPGTVHTFATRMGLTVLW